MNNLHRELAPVSDQAWEQIEQEAKRTLKRHLAARRVVDVDGPKGFDYSATGTGHLRSLESPVEGVQASQREVKAVVELRIPFELTRAAIDDVERGSEDSDWGRSRTPQENWLSPKTGRSSKVFQRQVSREYGKAAAIPR